ncbi:MAG: hypothetical protein FJX16_04345 [Alphaproteobacteria bacterium]|nr:hypothetical protein [Alphaproteobacteria bacterium]MBM3624545.1 hypothetical protein [Alphaproteobacteria bacterium]
MTACAAGSCGSGTTTAAVASAAPRKLFAQGRIEPAPTLDHAAFRRNRLNADDVTDSKSLERVERAEPLRSIVSRLRAIAP